MPEPKIPEVKPLVPEGDPQVIVAEDDGENTGGPLLVENDGEDEDMEIEPDSDDEDGMLYQLTSSKDEWYLSS
jgi:hypothetical protein